MAYKYVVNVTDETGDRIAPERLIDVDYFTTMVYKSCMNYLEQHNVVKNKKDHVNELLPEEARKHIEGNNKGPDESKTKHSNIYNGIEEWEMGSEDLEKILMQKKQDFIDSVVKSGDRTIYADKTYEYMVDCVHQLCRLYGQQFSYYENLPTPDQCLIVTSWKEGGSAGIKTERQRFWKKPLAWTSEDPKIKINPIIITYYGLKSDTLITIEQLKKAIPNRFIINKLIFAGDESKQESVMKLLDDLLSECDSLYTQSIDDKGCRNQLFVSFEQTSDITAEDSDKTLLDLQTDLNKYFESLESDYVAISQKDTIYVKHKDSGRTFTIEFKAS